MSPEFLGIIIEKLMCGVVVKRDVAISSIEKVLEHCRFSRLPRSCDSYNWEGLQVLKKLPLNVSFVVFIHVKTYANLYSHYKNA